MSKRSALLVCSESAPSAARRSANGSLEPVGFSSIAKKPNKLSSLSAKLTATVTGAVLNADGRTPGLTRQVVRVRVLPGRNELPGLEGRGTLSVALYRQKLAAPLVFIIPGTGSTPYFGLATYFATLFHKEGFHVAVLPSPMSWNTSNSRSVS